MNRLYFGDNLAVMRDRIADHSVDLVYLDPPFNSNADYNVLFEDRSGEKSTAQTVAFKDSWEWDAAAAAAFSELMREHGHRRVGRLMESLHVFLVGTNDARRGNNLFAYLVMMALRLTELHRVLKPTGSLYLHCDPTASHYLKLILDAVFGEKNFRNEIVWRRTSAHGDAKRYGRIHDSIFFYTMSAGSPPSAFTWNKQAGERSATQLARFDGEDEHGVYKAENLTANHFSPTRTVEWRGTHPGPTRQWRFGADRLEELYAQGRILLRKDGSPRKDGLKEYLHELEPPALQDIWTDIILGPTDKERLGYPTQKPIALLERILLASSNPGDVVLDPFCGCGTTIAAAERLGRAWIGIDVTYLAVDLIERRLLDSATPAGRPKLSALPVQTRRRALKTIWEGEEAEVQGLAYVAENLRPFEVAGDPTDLLSARRLFEEDPFQFQWWCCAMLGARGEEGAKKSQAKKGADRGIDGTILYQDPPGTWRRILVSVKGGKIGREAVQVLEADRKAQGFEIGVLVTLEPSTAPMRTEALAVGETEVSFYGGTRYPRLQIVTVAELLEGARVRFPLIADATFRRAGKEAKATAQPGLGLDE